MKFGICADLKNASLVADTGFDYIEGALVTVASASEEEFGSIRRAVARSGIAAEAFNVMFPGSFRLTGPAATLAPVADYLKKGFERAALLGANVQVFGSGAARNVPAGWPTEAALGQLMDFLQTAAAIAGNFGISIAVEPLNPSECNIVNTVTEALALAQSADLPNVGVLADWYHMSVQSEGVTGMLTVGKLLLHCHIANPAGRRFPLPGDGADFSDFFGTLIRIGYQGRVSIEGGGSEDEYKAVAARLKECL